MPFGLRTVFTVRGSQEMFDVEHRVNSLSEDFFVPQKKGGGAFGAAPLFSSDEDVLPQACLLYTSPSPRDRQKSRMPSSA